MSGRKCESGAEKRKLLLNREKEKIKCVKISNFLIMEQSKKNITNVDTLASEREKNLAKENGETQQTNITDENMKDLDDQQHSEKDVVQREDISNALTEKYLENVGFEFEKYVDVCSWPISLNNNFIDYILSHEMSNFQN
ncbi:uncharacterized protein TNCV_4581931 [Trichonephila clavipes]|nr:uncharacterized protein TNCV_4581931 [Trichonephila clavipes]